MLTGLYLMKERRVAAEQPAEQAKLVDVALGSDDEAERLAASRRLAELNREALKRIKRLRVVITTYSRPDVKVSLLLPDTIKKLLADSGVALVDPGRDRSDAILHIRGSCWPYGGQYSGGFRYSDAVVGGALLLETAGRLVYASAFFLEMHAGVWISYGAYREPSEASSIALERGLLLPLAPLLNEGSLPQLLQLLKPIGSGVFKDMQRSWWAAQALGELKGPQTAVRLASALKESDPDVRRGAAWALSRLRDPEALDPLIAALRDVDPEVRGAAAEALGQLRDPRGFVPVLAALKDQSEEARKGAAKALGEFGDPRSFEPLIAALKDAKVCDLAASALGSLKDPRALEPLMTADLHSHICADALGQLKGPKVVERLIAAIQEGNRDFRGTAAAALGKLGDPRALEPLVDAMGHDCPEAANALGELKDLRAVEPLIHALRGGGFWTRPAAAMALGTLKDARALEPLVAALKDGDHRVRRAAAAALGRLGDPRAVESLIAALEDKWPTSESRPDAFDERNSVPHAAAKALGELGDSRAIEPLRSLLRRECSPAAVTALVRLELRNRQAAGR